MTSTPKILAFAGSARKDSWNKKLVQAAADFAREAGAEVTVLDLADYELPLFNEDLESEGTPETAFQLKELFIAHDGFLIASPEYNSSISPLLKNTIDWVSRPDDSRPSKAGFTGKTAALLSASPGALGGMRGLVHLRDILGNIGVTLVPSEAAVSKAHEAFNENGSLADERTAKRVQSVVSALVTLTAQIQSA